MSDVNNPVPLNNALCIMRQRLFPFHYDPYTWVKEDGGAALEIKKSVMTIYLYQFQIARLNLLPHDPANFSKFFYQPERDSDTSEFIYHREDHNHLLKRITTCLREGLIPGPAVSEGCTA